MREGSWQRVRHGTVQCSPCRSRPGDASVVRIFRPRFVARATAAAIGQMPPIGPDCRGMFDVNGTADTVTMLSLKRASIVAERAGPGAAVAEA